MQSPRVCTPRRLPLGPSPLKSPLKNARQQRQSKVRVVCRVRPLLPSEVEKNVQSYIRVFEDKQKLEINDDTNEQSESIKLDSCYGETDSLAPIFKAEVEPVLPLLFCGCNATVFAYGATGSGKTYTMQGDEGNPGLLTLSLTHIFTLAERERQCKVELSYYELYMERCYDLLEPKPAEVTILEDSEGNIKLRGLAQVEIRTLKEFQELFTKGCSQRKTGGTGLNSASNRSHSVLVVTVTKSDETSNPNMQLVGKLSLIDLAGNEDNRRAGTDGARLAEINRINQSLFVLSNVINALNGNERRVPYRDSKLTRILQDSLDGTSSALLIACLSPGSYTEATQTLSFAMRSRQIANSVPENIQTPDSGFKLKASQDSKRKTPVVSPMTISSPLLNRLPSKSPSRFGPPSSTKKIFGPSPPKNISIRDNPMYSITEDLPVLESDNIEESQSKASSSSVVVEDTCSSPAAPSDMDRIQQTPEVTKLPDGSNSPPLSSMLRNLGSSLREALSPLPTNCMINHTPVTTPMTDMNSSSCKKGINFGWTAVERFSSRSRDFQGELLREYLDILNTGTREDLLSLKGVGKKRADYIMKLRENCEAPFVQLRDLQKIGLSAKQAEKLFQGNVVRQMLNI